MKGNRNSKSRRLTHYDHIISRYADPEYMLFESMYGTWMRHMDAREECMAEDVQGTDLDENNELVERKGC